MTATPVATCTHWWLVEPPGGPYSRETCRLCGATRMCSNVVGDIDKANFDNKRRKQRRRAVTN